MAEVVKKFLYSAGINWEELKDTTKVALVLKELKNLREAYNLAEAYCDSVCKKWFISPMVSCAYKCEVWKLKNRIFYELKLGQNLK